MTDIEIRYDGQDITGWVEPSKTTFSAQANGQNAGDAHVVIRDTNQSRKFVLGKTLELFINGEREWDGFVLDIRRTYYFDSHTAECSPCPHVTPRRITLVGVDRNILLDKRVLYDHSDPTNLAPLTYSSNTDDQIVLQQVVSDYSDLAADGITTRIEHVGSPDPWADFQVAGPGLMLKDPLIQVAKLTGAIFYITPTRELVYTDVNDEDSPFGISDQPSAGQVGCRELTITRDGGAMVNDAMVWGAGQGSANIVYSRHEDAASIALHGRWQNNDGFRVNLWKQESADHITETIVNGSPTNHRGHRDDKLTIECAVFEPGLSVAKKVAFESKVYGFSDIIPIRHMTISFPTDAAVRYDLVLSHDYDAPWNTAEFWEPGERRDIPQTQRSYCELNYVMGPLLSVAPQLAFPFDKGDINSSYGGWDWLHAIVAGTIWDGFTYEGAGYGRNGPSAYPAFSFSREGMDIYQTFPGDDFALYLGEIRESWGQSYGGPYAVHQDKPTSHRIRGHIFTYTNAFTSAGPMNHGYKADRPYSDWYAKAPQSNDVTIGFRIVLIRVPSADWDPPISTSAYGNLDIPTTTLWEGTLDRSDVLIDDDAALFPIDLTINHTLDRREYFLGCYMTSENLEPQGNIFVGFATTSFEWRELIPQTMMLSPDGSQCVERNITGNNTTTAKRISDTEFQVPDPFIAGTSRVWVNGIHQRLGVDYVENPNLGWIIFNDPVPEGANVLVAYDIDIDIAVDSDIPWVPTTGVYRPSFVPQLGWGSTNDGYNCNMASGCMLLDRHSLGAKIDNPPHMRSCSGAADFTPTTFEQLEHAWNACWNEQFGFGTITWPSFTNLMSQKRGAVVMGLYGSLPAGYRSSRTFQGGHSVYVNERDASGNFLVYDPLADGYQQWPSDVLKKYALDFSNGYIRAAFTQVTNASS